MLGALVGGALITILGGSAALAQSNAHQYGDDPIVRDLKAGKLSVHQAQALQQRSVRTDTAMAQSKRPSDKKMSVQKKRTGKAPIHQLTTPHSKKKNARQLKAHHGSTTKSALHKHKAHAKSAKHKVPRHVVASHAHKHHHKPVA